MGGVSNATPKKGKRGLIFGLALILFGIYVSAAGVVGLRKNTKRLVTSRSIIEVEVADTKQSREHGLSGRSNTGDTSGMLFVFEGVGPHCFWMKDMRFAVDMVWMNAEKQIIKVEQNVPPESYPLAYCPDETAVYGLEVRADTSQALGLLAGEVIRFQ